MGKSKFYPLQTSNEVLFSRLLFLPFLFAVGVPLPSTFFADAALLFGGITSLGLFVTGVMDAERKTKTFTENLQHHQAIIERNEELLSKLSQQFSTPLQRRQTKIILRRHDLGSWIRSGLNQAVNTWAISSAIFITWLGFTPVAPVALLISSVLAIGAGVYYSTLKAKDMQLEQQLEVENQSALSDYLAATALKSKALNVTCSSHSRLKRAVLQVIQSRRDHDRGLNEVVNVLKEYNLANYWRHKKTLSSAFIFGCITGSSVSSILTTFASAAFAISPPGWAATLFLMFGALWMGYNNYQVENDKLERERNKALTNRYREKTKTILEEIDKSLSAEPESHFKLVTALGVQPRPTPTEQLTEKSHHAKLFEQQPTGQHDRMTTYLSTCSA